MITLKAKIKPERLNRGAQHIWDTMIKLNKDQGTFTLQEVDMLCGGQKHMLLNIKDFARRWTKSEHIARVGTETPYKFHVLKAVRQFPSVRRDGTVTPRGQQAMWTAMRQIGWFTIADLQHASSVEEYSPEKGTVKSYIRTLTQAGFFVVRKSEPHTKPWHFKLKQSHNSGPDAPMIFRGKHVFDPNTKQMVGEPELTEVN